MLTERQKEHYRSLQARQRERSRRLGDRGGDERLQALAQLKAMLTENEERWLDALQTDLNKAPVEAYASELAVLLNELDNTRQHLLQWMKPWRQDRWLLTGRERTATSRYPYGSILILSPWNYPLQLALMPVIGALAAGNGCFLKPSEHTPATTGLLAELVPHYLAPEILTVVTGDGETAAELTKLEWDFIFFTGSQQTGKKVYQAAATHLTPVLLELGGKNPCILDETGLTDDAIRQIAWGKFLNAGQSCIAPDTVYVPRSHYSNFLERMQAQIIQFYGEDAQESPDYGRIIHAKQLEKQLSFLKQGNIYYGGQHVREDRYLSPTLLVDTQATDVVRTEEIFGPILPVVPYDHLEDVIEEVRHLPTPLAVYVFSANRWTAQLLERGLESGALIVNRVITHATSPHLPFGGKGKSGMGRYHGLASFQAFSYERSRYTQQPQVAFSQQYPPYPRKGLAGLRKIRKKLF